MSAQKSNSNTVGLNFQNLLIFSIKPVFQVTLKSTIEWGEIFCMVVTFFRLLYNMFYFNDWSDCMMNSSSSYTIYLNC